MTCPHCGAYSPKNTSVCNRCGRRLPMLEDRGESVTSSSGRALAEDEGYGYGYRQPQQTRFQVFLENFWSFLDDVVENPVKKWSAAAAAGIAGVLLIIFCCRSCSCSGCSRSSDSTPQGSTAVVSVSDVSASDISSSDASASDIAVSSIEPDSTVPQ